jgi:hypothetical protein
MLTGRAVVTNRPERPQAGPMRCLYRVLVNLVRVVFLAWTTLAIYYSNLPWAWARIALAVAFLAFAVWVFWVARRRNARCRCYADVFQAIDPAWHDLLWPEVAVMPRACRRRPRALHRRAHFEFRSRSDFTPRYEDAGVDKPPSTVDFYVSYWAEGPWPYLRERFDNAPPLSVSIETRPETGGLIRFHRCSAIRAHLRRRRRARHRAAHEPSRRGGVYHRDRAGARGWRYGRHQRARRPPGVHHLLSNSCTINIVRYANAAGRIGRFDFRHLRTALSTATSMRRA